MPANRFHVLFALVVAIAGASAQTQNFTSCGQACLGSTITNGVCHTLTNVTCLCTDTTVQTALGVCLQNCSAADLAEGKELQSSLCANATANGTTTSNSNSPTQHSSSSESSRTTQTASASSSTPSQGSNSASPVEQLPFISVIIAVAGATIGGAFAL